MILRYSGPLGIKSADFEALGDAIHESHVKSIDALLEKRPEFIKTGKFLIAYHLIPNEIANNVLTRGSALVAGITGSTLK